MITSAIMQVQISWFKVMIITRIVVVNLMLHVLYCIILYISHWIILENAQLLLYVYSTAHTLLHSSPSLTMEKLISSWTCSAIPFDGPFELCTLIKPLWCIFELLTDCRQSNTIYLDILHHPPGHTLQYIDVGVDIFVGIPLGFKRINKKSLDNSS